jgi:NIPSNAP
VGYWIPQDGPAHSNTLIYIISHESKEAAVKSWAEFSADPEWKKVAAASEADGKIVEKLERVYMDPTDYSPLK